MLLENDVTSTGYIAIADAIRRSMIMNCLTSMLRTVEPDGFISTESALARTLLDGGLAGLGGDS